MATPEEMGATMIANMKDKTGRTLPEWLKIANAANARAPLMCILASLIPVLLCSVTSKAV